MTPIEARALWESLLAAGMKSEAAALALNEILASVMIDYVTDNIRDDAYAVVIGRRIAEITDAMGVAL